MAIVRCYPVGNGDSSQILLDNGKRMLFDFRQVIQGTEEEQPVIDLAATLRRELTQADRDYFDVVAYTHGDDDHIAGSADFFHLTYARRYQGEGRIKIRELWVPAAFILEDDPNEAHKPLREEARHRLVQGSGIRVFSRPDMLDDWLRARRINPADRAHLITNAGRIVPGFNQAADGVEFFAHSPFIKHTDEGDNLRNKSALILHATFLVDGTPTRVFLIGDSESDILEDIVDTTRAHHNDERLMWDVYNIPHHCSHHALNPERGEQITVPVPKVQYLLDQGQRGAILMNSSLSIGTDLDRRDPPHVQAHRAYEKVAEAKHGTVLTTGDSKDRSGDPTPIDIEITSGGCKRKLDPVVSAAAIISSRPAPRAGRTR